MCGMWVRWSISVKRPELLVGIKALLNIIQVSGKCCNIADMPHGPILPLNWFLAW